MSLPAFKVDITEEQFKRINTVTNVFELKGSFLATMTSQSDKDRHAKDVALFEGQNIPDWPKSLSWNRATVTEKWNSVMGKSKIALGVGYDYAEILGHILDDAGLFIVPPKLPAPAPPTLPTTTTTSTVASGDLGLIKVNGVVKVAVDVGKYKTQATSLLSRVNKKQIAESIVKQSSEADFWYIVEELLKEEVTMELIGLLTARMLMPKDMRESLDRDLSTMDVFKNKQGKLAQSVIRLIGYVGLATVNGDPSMAQQLKFIKNPLLGDDVVDRILVKRSDETAEKFKQRKETHEAGFATYKTIMTEMKKHQEHYNKIPASTKAAIKGHVKTWCGCDIVL